MLMHNIIEFHRVSFRYPTTQSGRKVQALHDINLEIRTGECIHLAGPSGSGKSTLCRCMNGLIPHCTPGIMGGEVIVAGKNTRDHEMYDIAEHVGYIFQNPEHQCITGDVDAELAFGPEQLGWSSGRIDRAINDIVRMFGITHLRGRQLSGISWGERQRVMIASVVITKPEVLVLDEPFSGIDRTAASALVRILNTLNRSLGITLIIAEHRINLLSTLTGRMVIINAGCILYDGYPGEQPPLDADYIQEYLRLFPESPMDVPRQMPASHRPSTAMVPSVSLCGLVYTYPGARYPAIEQVDLEFYPGEITCIMGPNGSGKSTLIRHLNGLLRPDQGSVAVSGQEIASLTVAEVSRDVGVIVQHADYQLFEETIGEELAFAPQNFGMSKEEIKERISRVMQDVRISHLGVETPPLSLSVGEKQRVIMAGLFMRDTPVIAMDEPTIGLDTHLKGDLAGILRSLCSADRTVILATHDHEFALLCADRIIEFRAGKITGDHRPPFLGMAADSARAEERQDEMV